VLYTKYVYLFPGRRPVLLVAMIGAIVLTLRHKPGVKRQDIADQVARTGDRGGGQERCPPGPACEGAIMIGLGHYLTVAAMVFTLGVLGIFINRKNVIVILMSVELILLAVNINLVAFSTFLNDLSGRSFALLVLTVAAAEAAIGLAILVAYFRNRGTIAVEDINMMKG
jgi:NADH-quinone oxidoreductase subunit K